MQGDLIFVFVIMMSISCSLFEILSVIIQDIDAVVLVLG